MRGNEYLKPCDIAICLQIATYGNSAYANIGSAVGISTGQAFNGTGRLRKAGLISQDSNEVATEKLIRFCVHGVPIAFAPTFGPIVIGVPTAISAPPFAALLDGQDPQVWPDPTGAMRGQGLEPLYPGAVLTVTRSPRVYEMLTLIDVLRVGQARDRRAAEELLTARLAT